MNKNLFLLIVVFCIALIGCRQEEKNTDPYTNGSFVMNEGNFQSGNGSVSFISRTADVPIQNNIFENVNNFLLGDVVQSMLIHNNKGYRLR